MSPRDDLPRSGTRRRPRWISPIWLVPVMAGALAGYLVHRKLASEGPEIEITFSEASGLSPGKTDVRFRAVTVGTVEAVRLSEDFRSAVAEVRLRRWAAGLAREGTRFWIVQPEVSASGIQGLMTLVSGNYIEARPGGGPETDHFVALSEPPAEKYQRRDLEIVLQSDQLTASRRGTPIFYRGLKIGAVNDARLAPDARSVLIRAFINQAYTALVRDNSVFWNAGGVDVHFGLLHGLDLRAKSVNTLVTGGIGLATPDAPGHEVKDGQVFPLQPKPDDKWKKWSPSIKIKAEQGPVRDPAGEETEGE